MEKQFFKVTGKEDGKRVDLYLTKVMAPISRKKIKGLIDQGRLLINNRKVVIASWALEQGDRVELLAEGAEDLSQNQPQFLKVIYEDADLLVVEKDAGVPCEKSPVAWRPSMVAMVNQYLKRTHPHLVAHYVGLVHRLDADTSGLLIYTKTKQANKITEQFKEQTVVRDYLALVEGRVEAERGVLQDYLAQAELPGGKKVKLVEKGKGKKAITRFKVLERYSRATLLEVSIKTGRTHQIRVQLAAMRHPILGDRLYGNDSELSKNFKRQALHATRLAFRHPVSHQKVEVVSPLPRDLRRWVERLREGKVPRTR
ncbi:MAG: RluA family pseudouridine synthase [Deltaproteobacteria bacterium]|nr:RluA family pseudouridine synthase [Deltaproteobacteria bacterium]